MLSITHQFSAPPERVFAAWTTPDLARRWIWGTIGRDVAAEIDLRPGGEYRFSSTDAKSGRRVDFHGTFEDVEPSRRLRYTVAWNADMGYEPVPETCTVTLTATDGGGTDLAFVHEGAPEVALAIHEVGWRDTFAWLERVLAETA